MESSLKIGDVVTLKSGSPRMTVVDIDYSIAVLAWFVDEEARQVTCNINALTKEAE